MFLPSITPEVLSREPYGHAVDWWSVGVVACRMLTNEFPAPAAKHKATSRAEDTDEENYITCDFQPTPGTLPPNATLSKAARGLLMRLLDRDPRVRMKSLRQLQQSAFYMGYNFDHVKALKVSPRSILERYFPTASDSSGNRQESCQHFDDF